MAHTQILLHAHVGMLFLSINLISKIYAVMNDGDVRIWSYLWLSSKQQFELPPWSSLG